MKFRLTIDLAADRPEDAVPFDLKLPSDKVQKPGNLFGVTEGTVAAYSGGVKFDVDGNGEMDFGNQLLDINGLKAAERLRSESQRLQKAAAAWKPTRKDVFGALVGNIPTVGPVFFEDWKSSPFVLGHTSSHTSNRKDFGVSSRLNELTTPVNRLAKREKERRYTPEQAVQLQQKAQNRATGMTGRSTQAVLPGVKAQ